MRYSRTALFLTKRKALSRKALRKELFPWPFSCGTPSERILGLLPNPVPGAPEQECSELEFGESLVSAHSRNLLDVEARPKF